MSNEDEFYDAVTGGYPLWVIDIILLAVVFATLCVCFQQIYFLSKYKYFLSENMSTN